MANEKQLSDELELVWSSLRKWVPRLHLQDWRLDVVLARPESGDCMAEAEFNWQHYYAVMRLAPECLSRWRERHPPRGILPDNRIIEELVVHELVHLTCAAECADLETHIFGIAGHDGVLGRSFRNTWEGFNELWVDRMVRVLLEADDGTWNS